MNLLNQFLLIFKQLDIFIKRYCCEDSLNKSTIKSFPPFSLNLKKLKVLVEKLPQSPDYEILWSKCLKERPAHVVVFHLEGDAFGLAKKEFRRFGSVLVDTVDSQSVWNDKKGEDRHVILSLLDDRSNSNALLVDAFALSSSSASPITEAIRGILNSEKQPSLVQVWMWKEKSDDCIRFNLALVICALFEKGEGTVDKVNGMISGLLQHLRIDKVPKKTFLEAMYISLTFCVAMDSSSSIDAATAEAMNKITKTLMGGTV